LAKRSALAMTLAQIDRDIADLQKIRDYLTKHEATAPEAAARPKRTRKPRGLPKEQTL